ncbi:MAG: peptidoglycan-binding protein [Catenulispora sp.]
MLNVHHRRHRSRWVSTAVALSLCALQWTGVAAPAHAAAAPINLNSSSCPANIVQGDSGGCVVELQNLLDQHGAGVSADGLFGPATVTAVRVFQTESGIAADGKVGPITKGALYNSGGGLPGAADLNDAACPANIAEGAAGSCVVEIQNLLNDNGAHIVVDGSFGPGTLAAVKAFQAAAGLAADGIVGPDTKSALYAGGSHTGAADLRSPACPDQLYQGMVDSCVSTLQSLLNAHGHALAVDGNFGPDTLAAVKAFQAAAGLAVDGIVGPNTKTALYSNVGGGAPAPVHLTSSSCPADMKQGERDGCVTELQSLLNQNGARLAMDGIFGPATFGAVEDFQSANGLSVDGIVGPNTKSALYSGSGSTVQISCVLPPGKTTCASGDGLSARAVNVAYYLYNGPNSASQAAEQRRVVEYYNALSYNRGARYRLGAPSPGLPGQSPPPYGPGLGAVPYAWGGGHLPRVPGPTIGTCGGYTGGIHPCPANETIGLDCSGLVRWLYAIAAGKDVLGAGNTDSQTQRSVMHKLRSRSDLQPGDLIYWAKDGATVHVAMFLGNSVTVPGQGTGAAIIEESHTGVGADINLLSVHDGKPVYGYYHVSEPGTTIT